jgi:hypothetical protein
MGKLELRVPQVLGEDAVDDEVIILQGAPEAREGDHPPL